jgi:hypothetical protein
MTSKQKYYDTQKKIDALYPDLYLTDELVDMQNCGVSEDGGEDFWVAMNRSLNNSVGQRMSELGFTGKQIFDAGIEY